MRRDNCSLVKLTFGHIGLALCLSALIAWRGLAQESTSSIVGRVVDGKLGTPLAGAIVSVSTPEETVSQRTGPTGEFVFTFSKPVRVRVWADKSGYARAYAGQLGPTDRNVPSATIEIPGGARIGGVVLKLWSSGAIQGRITDGTEAVAGAAVFVLKREFRGDGFVWARVPLRSTKSDDRGIYRLADLAPGSYLVAVMGENRSVISKGQFPVFAPGVSAAATASVVTVIAGTEATGTDVQLDRKESANSVTGRILDGNRGVENVTVRLRRVIVGDETRTDFDEIIAVTDSAGTFRFPDVTLGPYKLQAVRFPTSDHPLLNLTGSFHGYVFGQGRLDSSEVPIGEPLPKLPEAPTLYAERDVVVDSRSSDVILMQLQPTATISGRVVFQDGSPPEPQQLPAVPMLIRPADGSEWGGIPQTRIESDGTFRSIGLPPGDYVVAPLVSLVRMSQTWTTVALTSHGMDVLGGAIRLDTADVTDVLVTLSAKSSEISGIARSPKAAPTALSTRVIIFPKSARLRTFYYATPSLRRAIQVNVSLSGQFRAALPPGDYLVAAINDELSEFWMTPDYLARLSSWATPVQLGIGDKVNISLEARSVTFAR